MNTDRRSERAPRISVAQDVVLITSSGEELRVRLSDVSREGFKIEHPHMKLSIGEVVTIHTKRSEARAEIRWATPQGAGGTFLDSAQV